MPAPILTVPRPPRVQAIVLCRDDLVPASRCPVPETGCPDLRKSQNRKGKAREAHSCKLHGSKGTTSYESAIHRTCGGGKRVGRDRGHRGIRDALAAQSIPAPKWS